MSAEEFSPPACPSPSPKPRRAWIDGAVIVALIAVVAAGYQFSPLLLPRSDQTLAPRAGCDLHKSACGAEWPGGGRLELSITPRPVPFVKPLQLEVRLHGAKASKVEVDFAGVGMNMGLNRVELRRGADGLWVGETSLAVCITESMAWQVTVLVESGFTRTSVPFRLDMGY